MTYKEAEGFLECDWPVDGLICPTKASVRARTLNMLRDEGWYVPWASEGEPAYCPEHAEQGELALRSIAEQQVREQGLEMPKDPPSAAPVQEPIPIRHTPVKPTLGVLYRPASNEVSRVVVYDNPEKSRGVYDESTLFELSLHGAQAYRMSRKTLKVTGLMLIHDTDGIYFRLIGEMTRHSQFVIVDRPVNEDAAYFEFVNCSVPERAVEELIDVLKVRYG